MLEFPNTYVNLYAQPAHYLLKFHNKNTKTMCEVRSKLTIKTPERRLSIRLKT